MPHLHVFFASQTNPTAPKGKWRRLQFGALCLSLSGLLGCPDSPSGSGAKASPSASTSSSQTAAPKAQAASASADQEARARTKRLVQSAIGSAKPKAPPQKPLKPYTGKTGTLRGVVRITGDEAPKAPWVFPKGCEGAAGTYGKLFRTGLGKTKEGQTLADAVVAVTNYRGYVAPSQKAVNLTIKNCAYSSRSVAMTAGQHLEIRNLEGLLSFVPHLDGARSPALNVAVPGGAPVKLHATKPGRYWLRDQMGRKFMVAHVFFFRFATTAVTKLDGHFEIKGIPVGKVNVSAMLPAAKLLSTTTKDVVINEGDNRLDLVLVFNKETHTPKTFE